MRTNFSAFPYNAGIHEKNEIKDFDFFINYNYNSPN